MAKSPVRPRKIADLIRHALVHVLQRDINDPRLSNFSITAVNVTPDLGTAKIYYVVLNNAKKTDIEKALSKAHGFIRHLVAEHCQLRYMPKLLFVFDESIQRSERITSLIDKAVTKDERRKSPHSEED